MPWRFYADSKDRLAGCRSGVSTLLQALVRDGRSSRYSTSVKRESRRQRKFSDLNSKLRSDRIGAMNTARIENWHAASPGRSKRHHATLFKTLSWVCKTPSWVCDRLDRRDPPFRRTLATRLRRNHPDDRLSEPPGTDASAGGRRHT